MLIPRRVSALPLAYFDDLNARADQLRAAGHAVISLGQAIPGFDPPAAAIDAARRSLDERTTHVYSADAGLPELRRGIADYLVSRHGFEVSELNILVTAGANQAIMLTLQALLDAGDEVLLPSPYFANHETAIRAVGAQPVEVPLRGEDGFSVSWESIHPFVTQRTKMVLLCTPSNPTGAVVPEKEILRFVEETRSRGIAIVSDETYMDFVVDGKHHSFAAIPEWSENVVVAGSFSKSFGLTGWRVGFLAASEALIEQAIKIQDAMVICAPVISQRVALAALQEAPDHPRAFLPELRRRREVLVSSLRSDSRIRLKEPAGGFFVFARIDGCSNSIRLSDTILEAAHLVTVPGSIFGSAGEGCLRLSYCAIDTETIAVACRRLSEVLTSASSRPG